MLLKTEGELIEIEKRALRVVEYLEKQREQLRRNFRGTRPPPALEQAAQFWEDFHYLIDATRTISVLCAAMKEWRVGGLPSASNLSETRPPDFLL